MRRRNHQIVKYLRTWLSSRVNIIFRAKYYIIDIYNVLISKCILWYELPIFISYIPSMEKSNYLKARSIYSITLDIWMLDIIIQLISTTVDYIYICIRYFSLQFDLWRLHHWMQLKSIRFVAEICLVVALLTLFHAESCVAYVCNYKSI